MLKNKYSYCITIWKKCQRGFILTVMLQVKFFLPRLILNFLFLLALIIHELGLKIKFDL